MAQRTSVDPTNDTRGSDVPLDEVTATYVPRTELGRRLLELRAEIVRSGVPLLNREELEREIAENGAAGVEITAGGDPRLKNNRIFSNRLQSVSRHDGGKGRLEFM